MLAAPRPGEDGVEGLGEGGGRSVLPGIGIDVRAATDGDVDAGAEREHIDQNDNIDVWGERRDAGCPPLATQRVRILIKPHEVCRKRRVAI